MIEAHCHLQNINIAHWDIKPSNIILTGNDDSFEFKVCDVGEGTHSINNTKTRTIVGTNNYLSPEMF